MELVLQSTDGHVINPPPTAKKDRLKTEKHWTQSIFGPHHKIFNGKVFVI